MMWIIIVNENRMQNHRIQKVWKKTQANGYLNLHKHQKGGRKPATALLGQLLLYDSHFSISFTVDLFLLTENKCEETIKPKMVYLLNQQMWCLIIEIHYSVNRIVLFICNIFFSYGNILSCQKSLIWTTRSNKEKIEKKDQNKHFF